jgi:signal transduction histidine kinase
MTGAAHFRAQRWDTGRAAAPAGPAAEPPGPTEPELPAGAAETLGRLATGILHELSHPLQGLAGTSAILTDAFEVLQATGGAGGAAARDEHTARLLSQVPLTLREMQECVDQAIEILRAARMFAHPGGRRMAGADLNQLVQSAVLLTGRRLRAVAEVETELTPLPAVTCYAGPLTQAMVNLLLNAADAIEETAGKSATRGIIRVRTGWDGHGRVFASVRDNGPGIAEENRSRVFQPFFTTKAPGVGTGQGLSLARTIVEERHGGILDFETALGLGTIFTIRLPLGGRPSETG